MFRPLIPQQAVSRLEYDPLSKYRTLSQQGSFIMCEVFSDLSGMITHGVGHLGAQRLQSFG